VGPRGLPLMVLLMVVAAGLLAVTLWLWPVLARRGAAAVALRLGLLVALQASVLGVVFVSVNRTYEFYASWSDLLGTDHSAAQVVAARPGGTGAVTAGQASPVTTLASSPVMAPGARRDLVGRLAEVRVAGPVSGITATGHVYLPPGYSPHSRPLPVIVVISRQAGSGAASYGARQVAAVAAAQIRAGRLAPAIIAVLSPAVADPPADARVLADHPAGRAQLPDLEPGAAAEPGMAQPPAVVSRPSPRARRLQVGGVVEAADDPAFPAHHQPGDGPVVRGDERERP